MSDYPACNLSAFNGVGEYLSVLQNVEIELKREVPGQPLVVMYADRAGAVSLGSTHVFPDGSDIRFHVKTGGAFQIKATAAGFEKIWRYVGISRGQENDIVFLTQVAPWDSETTFALGGLASIADGGNIYLFVSRVAGNLNNAPSFDGETGEPEDSEHWLFAGTMPTGPAGAAGASFQPVHVVAAIADRDDYDTGDDGSAFTEFPPGSGQFARISVLVESDSGNDNNPTLYFLQEADTGEGATWSAGFTFAPPGSGVAASAVTFNASGLDHTNANNVQEAIEDHDAAIEQNADDIAGIEQDINDLESEKVASDDVTEIILLADQAAYDALDPPDADTLYLIPVE